MSAGRGLSRRGLLAAMTAPAWTGVLVVPARAQPREVLTVAAFPLMDEIARAAIPAWQALHPDVELRSLMPHPGGTRRARGLVGSAKLCT